MEMFDTVTLHRSLLPKDAPDFVRRCPTFQTHDLGRGMRDFAVGEDRVLMMDRPGPISLVFDALQVKFDPIPVRYVRKRIELSATNLRGGKGPASRRINYTEDGEDVVSVVWVLQIRNGRVSSVKEKWRTVERVRPVSEM